MSIKSGSWGGVGGGKSPESVEAKPRLYYDGAKESSGDTEAYIF